MKTPPKTALRYAFAVLCVATLAVSCGRGASVAEESGIAVAETKDTIRRASLIFAGDVMVHMPQITAAKRDSTYDFLESFRYLKPVFDSADVVIVNLETTISESGRYSGYPLFSSPPELVSALGQSGVDIVALANNHICDKGGAGIKGTISTVGKVGLKYTGVFADTSAYEELNPLIFEKEGIRFALLNYTYGTNGMPVPKGMVVNMIDTTLIAGDIASARNDSAEVTIIYFHWGIEYMRNPSESDKDLAKWCHQKGVDIIIGSHPHVLQRPEHLIDSSGIVRQVTVYSLGNLVSNQRKRYTDGGMLVRLDISLCDSLQPAIKVGYVPTWTHVHWQDGHKYYHVLPASAADTLLKAGTDYRISYDLFISDTHKLLDGLPGFVH